MNLQGHKMMPMKTDLLVALSLACLECAWLFYVKLLIGFLSLLVYCSDSLQI